MSSLSHIPSFPRRETTPSHQEHPAATTSSAQQRRRVAADEVTDVQAAISQADGHP